MSEDYVTVARFLAPVEAHIVRARIEAEGIPAILVDDQLVQTNNLIAVAIGGVRIQVPATRAAEAEAVLEALRNGEFALGDGTDVDI